MGFVNILDTTPEAAEMFVLSKMTDQTHKFAVPIGASMPPETRDALERLMLRDWIRLIDISYISAEPGLMRVFRVMPEAVTWYREHA